MDALKYIIFQKHKSHKNKVIKAQFRTQKFPFFKKKKNKKRKDNIITEMNDIELEYFT